MNTENKMQTKKIDTLKRNMGNQNISHNQKNYFMKAEAEMGTGCQTHGDRRFGFEW